jgi:hypothetical protein
MQAGGGVEDVVSTIEVEDPTVLTILAIIEPNSTLGTQNGTKGETDSAVCRKLKSSVTLAKERDG